MATAGEMEDLIEQLEKRGIVKRETLGEQEDEWWRVMVGLYQVCHNRKTRAWIRHQLNKGRKGRRWA